MSKNVKLYIIFIYIRYTKLDIYKLIKKFYIYKFLHIIEKKFKTNPIYI